MSWDRQKAILEGRLRELEARLGEIETSLDAPKPLDWADSAIEREGDEVLEELGVQGLREIAQIRAALHRIKSGDYGDCARCGAPIAPGRLELVPEAPLCADCAGRKAT